MEPQTLSAEVRESSGKGPARQLRMRGLIPAIYYGPGIEPVKLTVSPLDLERALTTEYRRNQLIELSFNDTSALALVRDVAIDPVSRDVLHADFYAVARDRAVETKVPFTTHGRAVGVQQGGKLRKLFRDLPVKGNPQDIPAKIDVDISELGRNEALTVADLPLPEGVEVTYPAQRRVLFIEYKEAKAEPSEE